MKCKIVVGANYGDEGKGLVTRILSKKAIDSGKSCLNILYNGGCQRGHTVDYSKDYRHVYHHFGCGTLDGADTYFDKDFIVNPATFCIEYDELFLDKVVYIHPECRVSTPWDMMLNQMIEKNRGKELHGSVGMGIFETRKRYETTTDAKSFSQLVSMSNDELYYYCASISKQYLPKKVSELKISPDIIAEYMQYIIARDTVMNFIADLRRMQSVCKLAPLHKIVREYDVVVCEGGQGLALDEGNLDNYPYLTPSTTGSAVMYNRLKTYTTDIETCYVTRTYFTRHGAGPLPTECEKEDINAEITDLTNVPNEFQKSIRYGKFDVDELIKRIEKDKCTPKFAMYVTHNNYRKLTEAETDKIKGTIKKLIFVEDKYGKN